MTEIKEPWIFSEYLEDGPFCPRDPEIRPHVFDPDNIREKPPEDYKNIDIRLADFAQV